MVAVRVAYRGGRAGGCDSVPVYAAHGCQMTGGSVSFRVDGVPVAQGSKIIAKGGGRTWLRDANGAALKQWRLKVAQAADVGVTFDCPVSVHVVFHMPRPMRPKFERPAVKPDVDKLSRSVLDALTDGGLLVDDSRVVRLVAEKFYSETPGVDVIVREVQ